MHVACGKHGRCEHDFNSTKRNSKTFCYGPKYVKNDSMVDNIPSHFIGVYSVVLMSNVVVHMTGMNRFRQVLSECYIKCLKLMIFIWYESYGHEIMTMFRISSSFKYIGRDDFE